MALQSLGKMLPRIFARLPLSAAEELDRKKIILVILVCLVVVYLDFSFLIEAQMRSIRTFGPKIAKLRKDIGALNKELASMKNLTPTQKESLKKEEFSKSKRLILEEEVPSLLQEISDAANAYAVKIMQMKPVKDPKAKEEVALGARVLPLVIQMDVSCGYHALGSFISSIENSKSFLAVQELRINNNPDDYLRHRVSIAFKTFIKRTPVQR